MATFKVGDRIEWIRPVYLNHAEVVENMRCTVVEVERVVRKDLGHGFIHVRPDVKLNLTLMAGPHEIRHLAIVESIGEVQL